MSTTTTTTKKPLNIPVEHRRRLSYQPNAHARGVDPLKFPDVKETDKYQYFADKDCKWAFWTNEFGAQQLLNLFQESQKCFDVAQDRMLVLAKQKLCQQYGLEMSDESEDKLTKEELDKEVAEIETRGQEIYASKENLKKEYVTWSQADYQHPGFQLQYLKLKSIQRYTEAHCAAHRLYNIGYYDKLLNDGHLSKTKDNKILFRAVTLGGGPAFELIALRDFLEYKYPDTFEFHGVSLDVDDSWKDYCEALGFEFAIWDCRKRLDDKNHLDIVEELNTLKAKKNQLTTDEQTKIDELQELLLPCHYLPFDESIKQSISTIPSVSTYTTRSLKPTTLGTHSAIPLAMTADHLPKTIHHDDESHAKTVITFELTLISYAFLMYMSDIYQLDFLWSMLYDYQQTDKTLIPYLPAATKIPENKHHKHQHNNNNNNNDDLNEVQQEHEKDKTVDIFPLITSDLVTMKGVLILERVRKIDPIRTPLASTKRKLYNIHFKQLVGPNDDRQLLFFRHTMNQEIVHQIKQQQINRQNRNNNNDEQNQQNQVVINKDEYINPYDCPFDATYENIFHTFTMSADVMKPRETQERTIFPNVPYNDDKRKHNPHQNKNNNNRDNNNGDNNRGGNNNNNNRGGRGGRGGFSNYRSNNYDRDNNNNNNNNYNQHGGRDRDRGYQNNNNNNYNNNNNNNQSYLQVDNNQKFDFRSNNNNNIDQSRDSGYHTNQQLDYRRKQQYIGEQRQQRDQKHQDFAASTYGDYINQLTSGSFSTASQTKEVPSTTPTPSSFANAVQQNLPQQNNNTRESIKDITNHSHEYESIGSIPDN